MVTSLLLALSLATAPPAAPARPQHARAAVRPWVDAALGPALPLQEGPVWLRTQLRAGLPVLALGERLELAAVLPLSLGLASERGAFGSESSVLAFDLVPSARLALRGPAALTLYGDVGLGVAHLRYRLRVPVVGEADGSATALAARVAAGVQYALGRHVLLFVEPLHLLFHGAEEGVFRFGNTSFSTSTGAGAQAQFLMGAAYAF